MVSEQFIYETLKVDRTLVDIGAYRGTAHPPLVAAHAELQNQKDLLRPM